MIDCIEKQLHLQNNLYLQQQHQQHQQQPIRQTSTDTPGPPPVATSQQQALLPVYGHHPELSQPVTAATNGTANGTTGNELIGYYFGSISRETAEWILKTHGNQADGAYLLRSSGPNDDFVLSLMVANPGHFLEVLHYKIVETEDSFVALHGQVGDEKFATIDELIEKAQGVATKPRWPVNRQSLDSQILPPTYWGLTVDQIRLAILIKAKQWGFPLLSTLFQSSSSSQLQEQHQTAISSNPNEPTNVTTLNNETIRTLIYKSLHEFQPWFHGKITREEAERRIEEGQRRDGKFLVRERDNYSYAMCISHKRTTKHYRIDVLPTGELAIQDGRKFTSLMALVSHYTIMSDGLWCALTEACVRPLTPNQVNNNILPVGSSQTLSNQPAASQLTFNPRLTNQMSSNNLYCVPPTRFNGASMFQQPLQLPLELEAQARREILLGNAPAGSIEQANKSSLICAQQSNAVNSIKAPIKEWIQNINQKWSQLLASKNQHQSLQSFLFGSQNPLNNHCKHNQRRHHHHHHHHQAATNQHRRKCRNGHTACGCLNQPGRSREQHPSDHVNFQAPPQYCQNGSLTRTLPPNYWNINNICNPQLNNSATCNSISTAGARVPNLQSQSSGEQIATSSLLSNLPQNSGFTLNSQSFIGSPLFAVNSKQPLQATTQSGQQELQRKQSRGQQSGSGSSGKQVEEEKLISPAQSISANLNSSPYQLGSDIYGSQTSTAIVNDLQGYPGTTRHLPTTSSSSSSGCHNKAQNARPQKRQASFGEANQRRLVETSHRPLVCGNHAGPAFRYTNCTDNNNSFKPCYHGFQAPVQRAIDDLQLMTQSSQLVGPAALSKFVQFQDGQCLRTHRDTRSIQMAYLSSRQANGVASRNARTTNQVPNLIECNTSGSSSAPKLKRELNSGLNRHKNGESSLGFRLAQESGGCTSGVDEVDLMDCGPDEGCEFDFKYDAKLIKSSSIETLCGAGGNDDEQLDVNLSDMKTNSELLMSLQSCWQAVPAAPEILSPIQSYANYELHRNCNQECEGNQNEAQIMESQQCLYEPTPAPNCLLDEHLRKKHDLDEVTTAILAELTASLKAQVYLKNKRSGLQGSEKAAMDMRSQQEMTSVASGGPPAAHPISDPLELVNEFDTIASRTGWSGHTID